MNKLYGWGLLLMVGVLILPFIITIYLQSTNVIAPDDQTWALLGPIVYSPPAAALSGLWLLAARACSKRNIRLGKGLMVAQIIFSIIAIIVVVILGARQ